MTINRSDGGPDSSFSLEPNEFRDLILKSNKIWEALQDKILDEDIEKSNKMFRRSLYAVTNIKKGEKFTKNNIKIMRPGNGLEPKFFYKIINKKAKLNILKNNPINLNMFD